jgi:hypothetical protein
MDIQGNHSVPDQPKKAYEQQQRALIDANRALVRAAREDLSAVARERLTRARESRARRDEIELSAAAQAASEPSLAEREARVRELAEAHRMERLHTPERIERAAQRLLEG